MAGNLDFDVPAVVPARLVAFARARGVPAVDLERAIGLSVDALADPERPVRAHVMLPLWRLLLDRFRGEPLPIALTAGLDFAYLGLAGQLIRHSPTVRDGLTRALRYQRLYDPALYTTLTEAEGRAVFGIGHVEEVRALGVPLQFMAAVCVSGLRQLVGEPVRVLGASLEGAPVGGEAEYARWFGGPVRFGAPRTAITLDASLLDRPVVGADPLVARYLHAYADGLLASRPALERDRPLPDRVRAAIERGLLEGDVRPETIARRLALSTRSMQRHLAAAGVSFRALCDEVRRDTAIRLLREPGASVLEVAFALGYGDAPSFHRAFKRWTGRTPAEVRGAPCPP